ncbi:hypothetical protein GJ496_005901 [Pomphorhynchus laevis]|nr:hypothetical protein GJ496_005901 [Pomphorhynchus laevis]
MFSDLKVIERFEELRRMHSQVDQTSIDVDASRKSIRGTPANRRVLIVTFHLPVRITLNSDSSVSCDILPDSPFDLFNSLTEEFDIIWIGWPNIYPPSSEQQASIFSKLGKLNMVPVFLTSDDIKHGYEEFSQQVLCRVLHYLSPLYPFNEQQWQNYERMNETYFTVLRDCCRPSDLFFICDPELMLLPGMVRDKYPESAIGYFLWSNFPAQEIFRIIPWREQLLKAIMNADLIGMYVHDCLRKFLHAVYHICGHDNAMSKIIMNNHESTVEVFPLTAIASDFIGSFLKNKQNNLNKQPIGIVATESEQAIVQSLLQPETKYILSIDYLEGSKSLTHMVNLYDAFLRTYPDQRCQITLLLVALPGRQKDSVNRSDDDSIESELNATVARINGAMGTLVWTPVIFMNRDFTPKQRIILYKSSSIAFFANYLCNCYTFPYEYIQSRNENGVLLLSEHSAACEILTKSLTINPFDADDVVSSLKNAIDMPYAEQCDRIKIMKEALSQVEEEVWASYFVHRLIKATDENRSARANLLVGSALHSLNSRFKDAHSRLIILSYDGTLVGFNSQPYLAVPDKDLKELLNNLGRDEQTTVVLNTGRDRKTLEHWFADVNVDLIAEHGIWIRRNFKWEKQFDISNQWMTDVAKIVQSLVDRTPGAFLEMKEYSVAWHYRNVDDELGQERMRELKDTLLSMTANMNLYVIESSKVIDIKASGFHKGNAVKPWLSQHTWDFVMAIGNSPSDEETFRHLSPDDCSIKVGRDRTSALHFLYSHEHVRPILRDLTAYCTSSKFEDSSCKA